MHHQAAGALARQLARRITETAACGRAGRGVASLCTDDVWQSAADLMMGHGRASIVTGFFIMSASAPETDGPLGSAVLARALRSLSIETEILTCSRCSDAVRACSAALGLPPDVVRDAEAEQIQPSDLVIFIERPGHSYDGRYYDMRQNDISERVYPLDRITEGRACEVVAVGDGGNEAGMGPLRESALRMLPDLERSLSVVRSDVCVPCDVSNWGAYGIVAALSIAAGIDLMHTERDEAAMLSAVMSSGGVDGVSRMPAMSVDGFDISISQGVLRTLREIVREGLSEDHGG